MASSAQIGALRVSLGLDSAQFTAGIAKSSAGMKGLAANADIFSKQFVKSFAAAALGSLTLGAAIRVTKVALDQFGNVADKAAAAGLDSEFFQGIAYQAKLAGVDINGVADALATFNKNTGLAMDNRGKLYSTLSAINPELLKALQTATSQEQRVRLVADAIMQAKTAAEKAAIASAAWGDQGVRLVQVFNAGGDALDRQIQKAKDMGIIIDRDLIANADKLGDQWDTASQIIDTKLKSSLVSLSPLMVDLVTLAANFASYMGNAYRNVKPDNIPSWGKGGVGTQMNQHLGDVLRGLAYPETAIAGLPRRYSESQYQFGDMGDFFAPFQANAAQEGARKSAATIMSGAGIAGGAGLTDTPKKIDGIGTAADTVTEKIAALTAGLDTIGPAAADAQKLASESLSNLADNALGALGNLSGALSGLFKQNKAFAVSTAILQGLQGVAYALGSSAPPWNFINAAAVGIEAAANVANILATNENTTSMPSGGSSGASSTTAAAAPATPSTTVYLSGQSFSGEQVADLLTSLIKDNGGQSLVNVIRGT